MTKIAENRLLNHCIRSPPHLLSAATALRGHGDGLPRPPLHWRGQRALRHPDSRSDRSHADGPREPILKLYLQFLLFFI